jgi:hypothetical protein
MDESGRATIKDIKTKVIAMIEERQMLAGGQVSASPSKFWSDICSASDYMLGLPEEYFAKLRVHTYHLTRDGYYFYDSNHDPVAFRSANHLAPISQINSNYHGAIH